MALQLRRAGGRALPVLHQLEWTAPGAAQQFSSAADPPAAPPGRGRGRGAPRADAGPRAPGSGPPGAGRGAPGWQRGGDGSAAQRWQPRRPEDAAAAPGAAHGSPSRQPGEARGSRQPGAMSQLLQQERPRRPRSAAYRRFGERREEGGAGPGNVPDAAAAVPARLLDTPHDIIMRFEYALRDAADPKAPPVPLRDLVADLGDIANTDNLPLLKYYVTPDEWRSFASGSMAVEEQNVLMDRLATALIADEPYRQKQASVKHAIDSDPDYDLMASLGPEPRLRGSPRRQPVLSRKQIEDAIEAKRGELMQQAAMTDEEFEAAKAATAAQLLAAAQQAAAPVLPDHIARGRRLAALLDKALPRDHPHYAAARQRLEVLEANPGWPQERKMVFAKRMLKRLASL